MINNDYILEILQKTIDTLMENKNSILSISETLKTEYEQKKQELTTLQKNSPPYFNIQKNLDLQIDNYATNSLYFLQIFLLKVIKSYMLFFYKLVKFMLNF